MNTWSWSIFFLVAAWAIWWGIEDLVRKGFKPWQIAALGAGFLLLIIMVLFLA
jgi:hypothetical protein